MTWFVRWGIGLVAVLAGVVCLILNLGGFGIEELFGFIGAGLSIILINVLFRLGVQSDREHEAHEQEWRFYETHGYWPGEAPRGRPEPGGAPRGRPEPGGAPRARPGPDEAPRGRPKAGPDRPRRRPG